jgi:hypothetical protein
MRVTRRKGALWDPHRTLPNLRCITQFPLRDATTLHLYAWQDEALRSLFFD